MPKKTASARGGASRNRPKAQKSIQLVRPNEAVGENETQQDIRASASIDSIYQSRAANRIDTATTGRDDTVPGGQPSSRAPTGTRRRPGPTPGTSEARWPTRAAIRGTSPSGTPSRPRPAAWPWAGRAEHITRPAPERAEPAISTAPARGAPSRSRRSRLGLGVSE